MLRRDPERLERLRAAIRFLLSNGSLQHGHQVKLAQYYGVTRQRVNQIVVEQETRTGAARPRRRRMRDAQASGSS
jgi:phosphopantetheine adenylyltransferase